MRMRLSALASHVPAGRLSCEEIIADAGGSRAEARVFRRLFGIDQVAALTETESLDAGFLQVLDLLEARAPGLRPEVLILSHGQPLLFAPGSAPARRLAALHPLLSGVRRCHEVDQHNCSGLFWALDLAQVILKAGLAGSVLLLGGDGHPGLRPGARYVPGCTLMGDAFCGMIVTRDGDGPQISPPVLRTHPEFSAGRAGSSREMGVFFAAHGGIVAGALAAAGFDPDGPGRLLPHNVNRLAWQGYCSDHGLDPARVDLGLLPDIGHCYVCDPFLLLDRLPVAARSAPAPLTLLSVGMGGYVGACRLGSARALATPPKRSTVPVPSEKDPVPCPHSQPC
ncbi:hypothetical protein KM176_20370 [Pseudooceanicola sp. CBS1P-1]|uniref:Uncharacterized protein n=1 Tax=Pseudooceanicola albus TaxID=2692189 RepID=A0A6L7G9L8_9RHOB|nr:MULTISPECIES: hypothetical protein [Pseudooceanicola]MBT9386237.1 hypothetical protein [Pseudooceanicola endophyticus]MXN20287.1 hypothetical protein [Pseudooceanicola albus]